MSSEKINPTQLLSLVIMVTAIIIGWIAYHQYQPQLLAQYELTHFTFFLICAQGVILIITPPIAGRLGDHYRKKGSQRFRIISLGVGFAAMIFMSVALGLATFPDNIVAFLLPILVIFWLVAMNIFTSPAISTFELFAPFEKQPMALAILTLTAEFLYALEPVILPIIDVVGGVSTFILGGILVTVAGILLRRATKGVPDGLTDAEGPEKTDWTTVLMAGIRLGVPTALVFNVWPDVLQTKLGNLVPEGTGSWLVSGLLVVAGVLCLPLGKRVPEWGLKPSQRYGFTLMLLASILIIGLNLSWVVITGVILFAAALSIQSVSALPHALSHIAPHQKVYGVGIFFAGIEIPNAAIEIYQGYLSTLA